MRALSDRTSQFSQQIRTDMDRIDLSVRDAEGVINAMASQDMVGAIQNKQRAEGTLSEIERANGEIGQRASEIDGIGGDLARVVNEAVTALQFQDLASQLIGHTLARIGEAEQLLGQLAEIDISSAEAVREALEKVRASTHHNPVQQAAMATGDVELF